MDPLENADVICNESAVCKAATLLKRCTSAPVPRRNKSRCFPLYAFRLNTRWHKTEATLKCTVSLYDRPLSLHGFRKRGRMQTNGEVVGVV